VALDTEENEQTFQKLEQEATQHEASLAQVARKFDVRVLAEDTRRVKVQVDPALGEVRYMLLTLSEFRALKLEKLASDEERTFRVACAMLAKADSSVLWEDFQVLPFDVKLQVAQLLADDFNRFLPRSPKSLPTGSATTPTPKP
jgi:hypothetical protein